MCMVKVASDPSDELSYGAMVVSDYRGVSHVPNYCPDEPVNVPIAVFRSGSDALERHYAHGSKTRADWPTTPRPASCSSLRSPQ